MVTVPVVTNHHAKPLTKPIIIKKYKKYKKHKTNNNKTLNKTK